MHFTPFAFLAPVISDIQIVPAPATQFLLLGGGFTLYNAPTFARIVKLDSTGSADSSFNMGTGFNGGSIPYFTIQQPDGKYLAGGFNFSSYSGSANNRVVRINQNGTKDTTFNLGTGANNTSTDAASFSDNSNIMVGNFLTYSGSTVNGMVKIAPSGNIDTSFNMGFGFQGAIGPAQSVAIQSDGKVIVGVQSNQYSSSNNGICRTDLSSSYNAGPGTTFNYGVGTNVVSSGFVYTAVTQSDGKIIIGGTFTSYSGSSTNITRIIRLNSNGTQDTSFISGTGFNNSVFTIKVQTDGKIIVGGQFTTYSGSSVNRIVRLNTSGSVDSTFNIGAGISGSVSSVVYKSHIQSDGKIVIAGDFSSYSGSANVNIVRINTSGTLDTTFNTGTGASGIIVALTPTGSQYIIGGRFTSYNGSANSYIARIDSSGSKDTSFTIGSGFNNNVVSTDVEPNGKIIVAGEFTTYSGSGVNSSRIIRLNSNGTRDTTFNSSTGLGLSTFAALPSHLSVESDGKIYVGGLFASYSGSTVNNFVRINSSGSIDTTFPISFSSSQAGFTSNVRSLFVSSSNIYFFGDFTGYKRNAAGLIRINTDGTQDLTFRTGVGITSGGTPIKLLIQTDGKILVMGGSITPYSGSSVVGGIYRLNTDGTIDTTFSVVIAPNGNVVSAATESSGKIVIVGNFTTFGGSSRNRIVRINSSGSVDTTFNVGTGFNTFGGAAGSGQVIVDPDNSVYVTGTFTSYSGSIGANRIVKIQPSGAIDTTFNTTASNISSSGFNNTGTTIIKSGSSVLVTGQFTSYKFSAQNRGVMVNLTGSISSSFNIGTDGFDGTVRTWVIQSDGKILAGGDFTIYSGSGGINTTRIVRLNPNGTRDTTFNIGAGFNSSVLDLRVQSDGKIIAVGQFTTYSGSSTSNIARLNTSGTLDTTFNVGTAFASTLASHCKIQSDGKIIVVGSFTAYSGSAANVANRIVRINTDGTRDTTFNIGTGFNVGPEAVILQPDGKIITTGGFSSYSGSTANQIIRINTDGTLDNTFNVGTGLGGLTGYSLALQSDGKIICANSSQTYSGSTNRYIIRINTSGTLDNTFNANANVGISSQATTANSLAIDDSGSIYWGNSFTTFSGSFTPNYIVRLNTNGSVDETFNQSSPNFVNGTGKGANTTVQAILLL